MGIRLILQTRVWAILCSCLFACATIAQPKADFTADSTKGCPPLVVHFADQSTGNPTAWKWDLGNGVISTDRNPSTIYLNSGSYTVKLTVSNAAGEDSIIKTSYIVIGQLPEVKFSATPLQGCAPLNVQFTDASTSGGGTIAERTWYFGDGTTDGNTPNPLHTYTAGNTYSVTLIVKNSLGCSKSAQQPAMVKVEGPVNADFRFNAANNCKPPTDVTFENNSTQGTLQYKWNFGDGALSTDANPQHTYTTGGTFNVQLIANSPLGCTDTITKSLTVGATNPNFSVTSSCINRPAIFTNTSQPTAANATWDFGDGTTATGVNATHVYTANGTYQVKMVGVFNGCTDTITKAVTITNTPVGDFTSPNAGSCNAPATISFKSTVPIATNFLWDFGDGTTSTDPNPSHTYTAIGSYNVKLVAATAGGCSDSMTKRGFVKIGPATIVRLTNTPYLNCAPARVKLGAQINSSEPITYNWDFGDGTTSNEPSPSHMYNTVGNYNVQLIIKTASGCSDTLKVTDAVVLTTAPKVDFTAAPVDVCASVPIRFTDLSTGNITKWSWEFSGDDSTYSEQNPVHVYNDTGYVDATLTVYNLGCKSSLTKKNIVHLKGPVSRFAVLTDCNNRLVKQFSDSSLITITPPTQYTWDFGDGTPVSTEQSPKHTYGKTGNYTVILTTTNGECTYSLPVVVPVINENPSYTYQLPNSGTNLCRNDSILFRATSYTPANIAAFYWAFGDDSTAGPALVDSTIWHKFQTPGSYLPMLVTTDILGCKDTALGNNINVNIYGPTAAFTSPTGTCINGTVTFNDQSKSDGVHPIQNWIWNFGDTTVQTFTAPPFSHTYNTADSFNVALTVVDSYGCRDSVTKKSAILVTHPVASFTVQDTIRCSNTDIAFSNLSTGIGLHYTWSFGDGTTSQAFSPVHQYAAAGVYTVMLKLVDTTGCTDSMVMTNKIKIVDPLSSFNLQDTFSICPPFKIEPKSTATGYASLQWVFGDGNTSTDTTPTHYYSTAGVFDLQLIAKGYGQCTSVAHKTVVVKGATGTLTYPSIGQCAPQTIAFSADVENATTVIWDFGDGDLNTDNVEQVSHTYTEAGIYQPSLLLIDNNGCKVGVQGSELIKISGVRAGFGASIQGICDSSLVLFTDSTQSFNDSTIKYHWDFGDNTTLDNVLNPSHTYARTGVYTVKLVIDSKLACIDTAALNLDIKVYSSPVASILSADSTCAGVPLTLTGNNSDTLAATWSWLMENATSLTGDSVQYTFGNAGQANVQAIATNAFGCADTASKRVMVIGKPVVDAGLNSILCEGQTKPLQATGALTYEWSPAASLSCTTCASPIAAPDSTTMYYVTGYLLANCYTTDSILLIVKHPTTVSLKPMDTLCAGSSIQLIASGAEVYKWQPASGLNNTGVPNPLASPVTSTTYTVTGSDSANCFSDTASVFVKVFPMPSFNIIDSVILMNIGDEKTIYTTSSPDIIRYKWEPDKYLSCNDCDTPVTAAKVSIRYKATAYNEGGCSVTDIVSVRVSCSGENVFIPNTFSPNGDGMNDYFFPRSRSPLTVKSMRIFNRLGQVMFERTNFAMNDQSNAWDGTFQRNKQPADVYVYVIEVLCDNNNSINMKGNVTLLR